jgi:transposase
MTKQVKEQKHRRERRSFTPEFKADIVRLVRAGTPAARVAREHDLVLTSVRAWVQQAEANAGERQDIVTTDEREELVRLRRENKRLREEREILKAAATFFAKENA